MSVNYYDILEIDANATDEDIKKAYRKQAMKYHPDVNRDDPRAPDKFKLVYIAYDILLDPTKRRIYNYMLKNNYEHVHTTINGNFTGWRSESEKYAANYARMRYRDFEKVCMSPFEFHTKQCFLLFSFIIINLLGFTLMLAGMSAILGIAYANFWIFGVLGIAAGALIAYFAAKFIVDILRVWKIRIQEYKRGKERGEKGNCM